LPEPGYVLPANLEMHHRIRPTLSFPWGFLDHIKVAQVSEHVPMSSAASDRPVLVAHRAVPVPVRDSITASDLSDQMSDEAIVVLLPMTTITSVPGSQFQPAIFPCRPRSIPASRSARSAVVSYRRPARGRYTCDRVRLVVSAFACPMAYSCRGDPQVCRPDRL
jgi:hypothetical protein